MINRFRRRKATRFTIAISTVCCVLTRFVFSLSLSSCILNARVSTSTRRGVNVWKIIINRRRLLPNARCAFVASLPRYRLSTSSSLSMMQHTTTTLPWSPPSWKLFTQGPIGHSANVWINTNERRCEYPCLIERKIAFDLSMSRYPMAVDQHCAVNESTMYRQQRIFCYHMACLFFSTVLIDQTLSSSSSPPSPSTRKTYTDSGQLHRLLGSLHRARVNSVIICFLERLLAILFPSRSLSPSITSRFVDVNEILVFVDRFHHSRLTWYFLTSAISLINPASHRFILTARYITIYHRHFLGKQPVRLWQNTRRQTKPTQSAVLWLLLPVRLTAVIGVLSTFEMIDEIVCREIYSARKAIRNKRRSR